jgi:hypothetical protein
MALAFPGADIGGTCTGCCTCSQSSPPATNGPHIADIAGHQGAPSYRMARRVRRRDAKSVRQHAGWSPDSSSGSRGRELTSFRDRPSNLWLPARRETACADSESLSRPSVRCCIEMLKIFCGPAPRSCDITSRARFVAEPARLRCRSRGLFGRPLGWTCPLAADRRDLGSIRHRSCPVRP